MGRTVKPMSAMASLHPLRSRARPCSSLRTRVFFRTAIEGVDFAAGEVVIVVGNHDEIREGLMLHTREEVIPCWYSVDPIFVELHAHVEYRYTVLDCNGKARECPESAVQRSFVATGPEQTIEDDEGLYRERTNFVEDGDDDEDDEFGFGDAVPVQTKEQKLEYIRDLEPHVTLDSGNTVFLVALQLPVRVARTEEGGFHIQKNSSGGRSFAMLPLVEEMRQRSQVKIVSVGWPGIHARNNDEKKAIEKLLEPHGCLPIFPPQAEFEKFVSFCNSMMWPVFHDVMLFFQAALANPFDEEGWAAYKMVNNFYALEFVKQARAADLIWIHDYHFLMLPTFISKKLPMANIGLFLHTPFPSSDSFKSLPVREDLLTGMLCADQIGFQFFNYARNFFASVKRVLGIDPQHRTGGFMALDWHGRSVMIKVAHFVHPYKDTLTVLNEDSVAHKTAEFRQIFAGKTIFTSMDCCNGLSGLAPKFRAFRRFLLDHPGRRGSTVLVQYCYVNKHDPNTSLLDALVSQADAVISKRTDGSLDVDCRGKCLDDCAIFVRYEQNLDRTDRLALFRAGDVLLDTSVKDGLNLMPFEFITAHHDDAELRPSRKGAVIVSEFSGCSRVLLGSIRINPWNIEDVASTCEKILTIPCSEMLERFNSNLLYTSEASPVRWFEDHVADLRRARKSDHIRIQTLGFDRIRHVALDQHFDKLDIEAVVKAYRTSRNRVFFLDNEGTLAADIRKLYREHGAPKGDLSDLKSCGTGPCETVLECLRSLNQDNRNNVVILSGRDRKMLEDWFNAVPKIGLAAERGFYYKLPISTGDQWHCMQHDPDDSWMTYAFEIMRQFVMRTQGSFIENKGSALVWQYRDADPHFGSWQAKELSSHLKELLFGFEVDVLEGKGYVEVKLRGINKGVAVQTILKKVRQTFGEVDFMLCIGDDRSDEDMFDALKDMVEAGDGEANNDNISQKSTTDGDSDGSDKASSKKFRRVRSPGVPIRAAQTTPAGLGAKSLGGSSMVDLTALVGGRSEDVFGSVPARRFFTCTVGQKASAAKYYLDDVDEVSELLNRLKLAAERMCKDSPINTLTWSGGEFGLKKAQRVGSMPGLSTLAFGAFDGKGSGGGPGRAAEAHLADDCNARHRSGVSS